MQAAIVVTWTHPFVGREEKALAYGGEVQEFWGKQAAEGKCSPPELFFSETGVGLWFVKRDRDTLMRIHDSDEARMLTMKGELFLDSFKLEFFYTGEAANEYMTRYGAALAAIA
jgi:hypothetical protein